MDDTERDKRGKGTGKKDKGMGREGDDRMGREKFVEWEGKSP